MKRKDSIIRTLLAHNMKRGRRLMNITQAELADKCMLSTSFIAEIELCRKFPSPEVLERIGKALNMLPYHLFLSEEQWKMGERGELLNGLYSSLRERLHSDIDSIIDSYR